MLPQLWSFPNKKEWLRTNHVAERLVFLAQAHNLLTDMRFLETSDLPDTLRNAAFQFANRWRIFCARVAAVKRLVMLAVLIALSVESMSITNVLRPIVEQKTSTLTGLASAVDHSQYFHLQSASLRLSMQFAWSRRAHWRGVRYAGNISWPSANQSQLNQLAYTIPQRLRDDLSSVWLTTRQRLGKLQRLFSRDLRRQGRLKRIDDCFQNCRPGRG